MASFVFRFLLQLAFAVILFIFGTIVLPSIVIICLTLKSVVLACARLFRKDLHHFVYGPGAVFAQDRLPWKPNMNICEIFMFDGKIELEKFISLFQERVIEKVHPNGKLMYPELQQFWTPFLNYYFWTPVTKFSLRNHVRLYDYGKINEALKLPDSVCTEDHLCRALGPLLETPWKKGQSPWELLLVQNFKSAGSPSTSTAVVFRMHHGMADGYSIIKLLLRDFMLVPPKIEINFPKFTWWEKLGLRIVLPFKLPWDMAGSVINAFDGNHCWHSWTNKPRLSRKLRPGVSRAIDVQVIKDIKNKHGVGYNAVLCSLMAGACRRVMEEVGQLVPKEMSCFVPIPLPNHPDGLTNHVTALFFRWPMDENGKERSKMITKRMSPNKYSTEMLGNGMIVQIVAMAPNIILKNIRGLMGLAAVAFSSFPVGQGSPEFVGLGVKLVDMFGGMGPGFGTTGVYVHPTSLNGKQRITVNFDKGLFPCDKVVQKFEQYIDDELNALLFEKNGSAKHDFKNK